MTRLCLRPGRSPDLLHGGFCVILSRIFSLLFRTVAHLLFLEVVLGAASYEDAVSLSAYKKKGGTVFPLAWNDTDPPQILDQVHRIMQSTMPLYRVPNRQGKLHWFNLCQPEALERVNAELEPLLLQYMNLSDVAEWMKDVSQRVQQQLSAGGGGQLQDVLSKEGSLVTTEEAVRVQLLVDVRKVLDDGHFCISYFLPETLDLMMDTLRNPGPHRGGASKSIADTGGREEDSSGTSSDSSKLLGSKIASIVKGFLEHSCDTYGAGGGMCIMQAHRYDEPDKRDRRKILLNSNCQIWKPDTSSGMLTQLFHCPLGAPIALFVLPKSGTSSAVNYILDVEPYTRSSLGKAMESMLIRPKVMIDWLASELDFWGHIDKNDVVQDLSQRLMHRFPPDAHTQQHWTWMRFLPPAHLCPNCCLKQKWRKKVVLARNPFVRMASMYQFAWLPTGMHPSEAIRKAKEEEAREVGSSDEQKIEDGASVDDTSSARPVRNKKRLGPYQDWTDFSEWLRKMLDLRATWRRRNGVGFTRDLTEYFADKSSPQICTNSSTKEDLDLASRLGHAVMPDVKLGEGFCYHVESEVDVSDIFHMRPFEDMINDETFLDVNGPIRDLDDFFVLHLETISDDLAELYVLLCEEYNYCEPPPRKFPKVLPASNTERKICDFNPRTLKYANCETTWEALWTPKNVALVREHYAFDLEFFGYSESPEYVMPLKWM
ncbi:unnamed protein product [Amoebophrya sp. A25]|nr:unnamed protein product [Amoebophrya sp. A25]|eukprot:GSA25T00000361001.1